MKKFKNQVAVIVGGARGIGKAIAERLVREGAQVSVLDVLKSDLEELTEQNTAIKTYIVDITDEKNLQNIINNVIQLYGRLDIMVNSVGILGPTNTKIHEYSLEDFQKVLDINLIGAFNITKVVLPQMSKQGYGRILHVASMGGKEGNPGMAGYVASKAGLIGLIKGVGKEYARTGITVNGIAPAVIATEMNNDTNVETLKYMTDKIPMKRLGTVEEVAALVCWIVSEEATFNTGFTFDLSGGRATY